MQGQHKTTRPSLNEGKCAVCVMQIFLCKKTFASANKYQESIKIVIWIYKIDIISGVCKQFLHCWKHFKQDHIIPTSLYFRSGTACKTPFRMVNQRFGLV
jgi:hypothetical protein